MELRSPGHEFCTAIALHNCLSLPVVRLHNAAEPTLICRRSVPLDDQFIYCNVTAKKISAIYLSCTEEFPELLALAYNTTALHRLWAWGAEFL